MVIIVVMTTGMPVMETCSSVYILNFTDYVTMFLFYVQKYFMYQPTCECELNYYFYFRYFIDIVNSIIHMHQLVIL